MNTLLNLLSTHDIIILTSYKPSEALVMNYSIAFFFFLNRMTRGNMGRPLDVLLKSNSTSFWTAVVIVFLIMSKPFVLSDLQILRYSISPIVHLIRVTSLSYLDLKLYLFLCLSISNKSSTSTYAKYFRRNSMILWSLSKTNIHRL